mgnify:CR=1 FL=1
MFTRDLPLSSLSLPFHHLALAGGVFVLASVGRAQVNAPVAPDAIYVGRVFPNAALSVIDLNGFGQSTGDPRFDFSYQSFPDGWSQFPTNPNLIQFGPTLFPPLFPGVTTIDGGSSGALTLVRDAQLSDRLVTDPTVLAPGDMMLGAPLDRRTNNGLEPTGCQAGGGNVCAITSKQVLSVTMGGPHTLRPTLPGEQALNHVVGGGNPISFAPHPNPPRIVQPPLCALPRIAGEEPSSIYNTRLPLPGLFNLLIPGDALALPPTGLLSPEQNSFFVGPDRPGLVGPLQCEDYMIRQQIGHYLYVTENERDEVLVLNSNTFEVLERIVVPDPTDLAMGPNLDLLAVSCRAVDQVVFIDIDPMSATFHQVVDSTPVGDGPRGIAWDPGNEDILVCNENSNTVSILSVFTRNVRKTLSGGFSRPFDVAITQRQSNFGYQRNVYFAYILDRAGAVHLFESGPNGVNGWGYDAVIGKTARIFKRARSIQPDPRQLTSGVWIAHNGQLSPLGAPTGLLGGAVTNLVIDSSASGQIPLTAQNVNTPQMRQLSFRIAASIGSDVLSGLPTDIAFDNQRNLGALQNVTSAFGSGSPVAINGKSQVRNVGSAVLNTSEPRYLFLAVRESTGVSEAIDVIDLTTHQRVDVNPHQPGTQSIPAPGARLLADYFRQ